MTEKIYDGPIDDTAIRQWGYDEDMLFMEQDEDLVLGFEEHFPALAELAKDPACPKSDYALSIIDFRLMFQALYNRPEAASQIEGAMKLFSGSTSPEIENFLTVNELRLALLTGSGEVSLERAMELGRAALNGVSRNAEITVKDNGRIWEIQLSIPPLHQHKEWLTIEKHSGKFSFHR